ncbi:MAG: alpha/beta hydrolase fold domain-containing protein [Planctomycetota bacterium]
MSSRSKPISSRLYLSLLVFFVIGSLVMPARGQADGPDRRIAYKQTVDAKGNEVTLHLHVFLPEGAAEGDSRPAIVFFFGGGWVGGAPTQFYPHCAELASRGVFAAAAEYRVHSRHGTMPQACVADGKSAVRYLRQHAEELGIDPDRIAAGGGSAGGHVAAATALVTGFEEQGEDQDISSRPDLLVLFNPVIDTTPPNGFGWQRMGDDAEELSPIEGVYAEQPPSVIFHGKADTTTPIDSVRRFKAASERVQAVCVLHEYDGAAHGFFNMRDQNNPDARPNRYYHATVEQMLGFLDDRGYLPQDEAK